MLKQSKQSWTLQKGQVTFAYILRKSFILWITLNRPDPDTYEDIPRLTYLLCQREIFLKLMLAQGFKGFKNRGGFIQSVMLSMAYFIVFILKLVLR